MKTIQSLLNLATGTQEDHDSDTPSPAKLNSIKK